MLNNKHKKGFTLIEMLVVLMIISIIMPATFMILYNILQQQVKLYKLVETRRQGDYILGFMKEKIIRDAKGIQDTFGDHACTSTTPPYNQMQSSNGNGFFLIDKSSIAGQPSELFSFHLDTNTLKFTDTNGAVINMNNTQVLIEQQGANPLIECYKNRNEVLPMIRVTYEVVYNDPEAGTNKETSLYYSTRIRLRNQ